MTSGRAGFPDRVDTPAMRSRAAPHSPRPLPHGGWAERAPGFRVALAALVLGVVALVVAWVGAHRTPVEPLPAAGDVTGGAER